MRNLPVEPVLICPSDVGFSFFKSLIASLACTSFLLTHLLSKSGYPLHLIRYCNLHLLPNCQESRIFLTLYSSSLSIKSGGGLEQFGPWMAISWYGVRRLI